MNNETRVRQRRSGIAPLTALRLFRLAHGITAAQVAHASGLSSFRVSIIERDPAAGSSEEIEAYRTAVEKIRVGGVE